MAINTATIFASAKSGYFLAFTQNPIYAIVVLVIGFAIGWFLHYQVFGY